MSDLSASGAPAPSLPRGLAVCRRLLAHLGRIELVAAIIALLVVVALSTAQAFLRYLFGVSLWWAQEIAEVTVLVTYFLGIAYVFKTRQEIFIEVLSGMFPARVQLGLYLVEQVLSTAFALALLWLVWLFTPTMFNLQSPVLKLPGAVTYVPLVWSSLSIIVTGLYHFAFGSWAMLRRIEGRDIVDIEVHGLILKPWTEPN